MGRHELVQNGLDSDPELALHSPSAVLRNILVPNTPKKPSQTPTRMHMEDCEKDCQCGISFVRIANSDVKDK